MQKDWLAKRFHEGRNVAVILGCPDGGVVYTDLSWGSPLTCEEYRARIKTRKQLAQWIEGIVCRGSAASQRRLPQVLTSIESCSPSF
jgi:hypothetical protein